MPNFATKNRRSCRTHHDTSPPISVRVIPPILSPSHMMTTRTNLLRDLLAGCHLWTSFADLAFAMWSYRLALSFTICCPRFYPTFGKTAALASYIIIAALVMPVIILPGVSGAQLAFPISGTFVLRASALPPPDVGLLPNGHSTSVGRPFLDACNVSSCLPGDGQVSWVPQVKWISRADTPAPAPASSDVEGDGPMPAASEVAPSGSVQPAKAVVAAAPASPALVGYRGVKADSGADAVLTGAFGTSRRGCVGPGAVPGDGRRMTAAPADGGFEAPTPPTSARASRAGAWMGATLGAAVGALMGAMLGRSLLCPSTCHNA